MHDDPDCAGFGVYGVNFVYCSGLVLRFFGMAKTALIGVFSAIAVSVPHCLCGPKIVQHIASLLRVSR